MCLPSCLFPSGFLTNFINISYLLCACYMPCSSHPHWFDHHNNIWWSTQVMKLHTV
jgi:hypothetical protein